MSLTDDQRRVLAEMCGWNTRPDDFDDKIQWWWPEGCVNHWERRYAGRRAPPPIETMPEEWSKLMERLRVADIWLVPAGGQWEAVHDDWRIYGALGECVCLAALAMEDGNG